MAYGAIGGMNLVFLIMPYLAEISFFNNDFLDGLVSTLFVIVALIMVKDFIAMVSDFVGGGDANKDGEAIDGEVGKLAAKAGVGAGIAGVAGLAVGGAPLLAAGLKGYKQLKSKSRFRAAREKHGQAMSEKYAAAEKEKDDALKDISDREAEFRQQAEESFTKDDEAAVTANILKNRGSEIVSNGLVDQGKLNALKKQEKEKILQQRTQDAMKAQQDQVMENYKNVTAAIGEEDRKTEPKLYDYQVHGFSAAAGALKYLTDKDHRQSYKDAGKSVVNGILPALGNFTKEGTKIFIKGITGDSFTSGLRDGLGGDGIGKLAMKTFMPNVTKKMETNKTLKETIKTLETQQKAQEKVGKDTTSEKLAANIENLTDVVKKLSDKMDRIK